MYIEIWVAVQDIFHSIPCDICHTIGSENRATVNKDVGDAIGIPSGVYHRTCVFILRRALTQS